MRTVKVAKLPMCNAPFCKKEANCDAPLDGRWGNWCPDHHPADISSGCMLEVYVPVEQTGK